MIIAPVEEIAELFGSGGRDYLGEPALGRRGGAFRADAAGALIPYVITPHVP